MTEDIDELARAGIRAAPDMTADGWRKYAAKQLGWASASRLLSHVQEYIKYARAYLRAAELVEGDHNNV